MSVQKAIIQKAKELTIFFYRKLREQNGSVKVTLPKDIALTCKYKGGQTVKIYALYVQDKWVTIIEPVDDREAKSSELG